MRTSPYSLRLRHRTHHCNPDEDVIDDPDCSHLVSEKEIWGGGMPNTPDSSGVLVVLAPYLGFCCVIVACRSCHRFASVGIDLSSGRVRACHRESLGSGGAVCPAIVGCRMGPDPAAKDER